MSEGFGFERLYGSRCEEGETVEMDMTVGLGLVAGGETVEKGLDGAEEGVIDFCVVGVWGRC